MQKESNLFYAAGTQFIPGCNASKNCFKEVSFPRNEKTTFVLSLAPVQIRIGACVGLGFTPGVTGFCGVVPLGEDVHWKSRLFERNGASEKLNGLLSGSRYPMIMLPPKVGSCTVPDALNRHVFAGSVFGKKTEKPRLGST